MALYSEKLYSDPVVLLTAPLAPTLAGTYAARSDKFDVADEDIVLTWIHNPLDGSAQTNYELEISIDDGQTWTSSNKTASAVSSHDLLNEQNGKKYLWHVRTWGSFADPSPWSANGVFYTSAKPTCTITTPSAPTPPATWRIWPMTSATVIHLYGDTENTVQSRYRVELWDENEQNLLWWRDELSDDDSVVIDYPLSNGTGVQDPETSLWSIPSRYVIKKRVWDADNVPSNWATRKLEIVLQTPPATPDAPSDVVVTYNKVASSTTISYTLPATATGLDNPWTHARIDRWNSVTGWENDIATVVPAADSDNGKTGVQNSYTDTTVVDNRKYQYRVIAVAEEVYVPTGDVLRATSAFAYQPDFTITEPPKPQSITIAQPEEYVQVSWTNICTYPAKVRVQRKNITMSGEWLDLIVVNADQGSIPDITIMDNTEYQYRLRTEYSLALYSDWDETSPTIETRGDLTPNVYSISIPPVRRNGPRESVKENIEAGEFSAIMSVIDEKIGWLMDTIAGTMDDLETTANATDEYIEPVQALVDSDH